jgi:hypothetical protein
MNTNFCGRVGSGVRIGMGSSWCENGMENTLEKATRRAV